MLLCTYFSISRGYFSHRKPCFGVFQCSWFHIYSMYLHFEFKDTLLHGFLQIWLSFRLNFFFGQYCSEFKLHVHVLWFVEICLFYKLKLWKKISSCELWLNLNSDRMIEHRNNGEYWWSFPPTKWADVLSVVDAAFKCQASNCCNLVSIFTWLWAFFLSRLWQFINRCQPCNQSAAPSIQSVAKSAAQNPP